MIGLDLSDDASKIFWLQTLAVKKDLCWLFEFEQFLKTVRQGVFGKKSINSPFDTRLKKYYLFFLCVCIFSFIWQNEKSMWWIFQSPCSLHPTWNVGHWHFWSWKHFFSSLSYQQKFNFEQIIFFSQALHFDMCPS